VLFGGGDAGAVVADGEPGAVDADGDGGGVGAEFHGVAQEVVDAALEGAGTGEHREAGLLTSERRGTWVYYRVEPSVLAAMGSLLGPSVAR
jgi:DNA-binding transcriptional ArsR family regulator